MTIHDPERNAETVRSPASLARPEHVGAVSTAADESTGLSVLSSFVATRFRVSGPLSAWPDRFCIVSARDGKGKRRRRRKDPEAHIELMDGLPNLRVWSRRLADVDPLTGRARPWWALEISTARACGIGRRFGQDAIFSVEGDDLFVVECAAPHARVPAGRFRDKLELDSQPRYPWLDHVSCWLHVDSRSGKAFAAHVDRVLVDDPEAVTRSGRVLKPKKRVSLVSGLLAALPDRAARREAFEDIEASLGMSGVETLVSRFGRTRRILHCELTDSMVSGEWGLGELALGHRGYLYDVPDFGIGADESLPILGAWEPVDDRFARWACILAVHAREWRNRGWPPYVANTVRAEPALLFRVLFDTSARSSEDRVWGEMYARLREWLCNQQLGLPFLRSVAALAGVRIDHVDSLLLEIAGNRVSPEAPLTNVTDPEERRAFVAMVVRALLENRPDLARSRSTGSTARAAPGGRGRRAEAIDPIEHAEMGVCGACAAVVGPVFDNELGLLVQTGRCPAHRPAEYDRRWGELDLTHLVDLCKCCGAVALPSLSRWAIWFCNPCKEQVLLLNARYKRCVLPIGRHSVHAGWLLRGDQIDDPVAVDSFVKAMHNVFETHTILYQWEDDAVRMNLEALGYDPHGTVSLVEYVQGAETQIDRAQRFREMCAYLDREGRERLARKREAP